MWQYLVLTLIIFACLYSIPSSNTLFYDNVSNEIRKIHTKNVIKLGGIVYAITAILLFEIKSSIIDYIVITSILILLIGLIADIKKNFSAISRLMITSFILIVLLNKIDFSISQIDIKILDTYLEEFIIFSYIFTILCILFCLNGTNLIDGQHGLALGSVAIILFNLKVPIINDLEYLYFIDTIFLITLAFFCFNFFFANIRLGDTGSYYLGFTIAAIALYANKFAYIEPFHIACILFYPACEAIFSYLRRIIYFNNPFKPDDMHLHSLIFKILNQQKNNNRNFFEINNRLTSVIIILSQIIIWIFIYKFNNNFSYKSFFCTFCLIYLISYLFLFYFHKRERKS